MAKEVHSINFTRGIEQQQEISDISELGTWRVNITELQTKYEISVYGFIEQISDKQI